MLLLLTGCYLPSAYGLRDDGLLPTGPEVTLQGVQSGLFSGAGNTLPVLDTVSPWYGGQGRFRVSDRVGLRFDAAALPIVQEDESRVLWQGEADVLVAITTEPAAPVTVTASAGTSAILVAPSQPFLLFPGLDTGVTVSHTLGRDWHPFAGVRLNPVFFVPPGGGTAGLGAWAHTGAGIGWRPKLGAIHGVFTLDGGWDHGFGACLRWSPDSASMEGCDTWSVGLSAGATFDRRAR